MEKVVFNLEKLDKLIDGVIKIYKNIYSVGEMQ